MYSQPACLNHNRPATPQRTEDKDHDLHPHHTESEEHDTLQLYQDNMGGSVIRTLKDTYQCLRGAWLGPSHP